jgi:hypothetical protein
MGPVVTINSATLVNKGLKLIEAMVMFDVPADRIDVVVHPQSVVHSMVTFVDGSTLVQASPPDMRLPIALALNWPDRVRAPAPACTWQTASTWTFDPLDGEAFPAVGPPTTAPGRPPGTAPGPPTVPGTPGVDDCGLDVGIGVEIEVLQQLLGGKLAALMRRSQRRRSRSLHSAIINSARNPR